MRYPGALLRWHAPLVGAQVRRDDARVGADLGRGALGDHTTGLQAVDPVADREDQRQVVLDDDQRGVELRPGPG